MHQQLLVEMAEAILKTNVVFFHRLPILKVNMDMKEFILGVPTILGANGIEKVIELELTDEEKAALDHSAESVRNVMAVLA